MVAEERITTFKFTTDYLLGESLLPGFVEGYSKIHHDETRHIGYGVWFLRETVRAKPEMADVVRQTLRDLLPSVAASLAPPHTGSDLDLAAIGASSQEHPGLRARWADPAARRHRRAACTR
jgi:ribonucleoside-diphosphate reductase beta chain